MSLSPNRVTFEKRPKRSKAALAVVLLLEHILSVFFVITLASQIIFPEQARAVVGVSKILSYQGRLTDTSGNPLGGAGTNYCFRFSIYDAESVGTKLWPAGTPVSQTINVANGIFSAGIGAGGDDLATLNFYDNDTVYLNIEVNATPTTCSGSWEGMTPRQRMDATAYARVSRDVYGDLLKTDNSLGKVQVGTGSGAATPIYLNLDWKNTADTIGNSCTSNGTIWYNSAISRALVCEEGSIRILTSTSTITGIKEQSTSTPISSGTVNFSGSNNITVSQTGQTLQFSVPTPVAAFGVSNLGNTQGNTGTRTGVIVLSGGNSITLSQATGVATNTIGIIGPTLSNSNNVSF
ncbi:MAG: hypothetical protein AAB686_00805, partial [Patescibacteria group bacterium]